MVNLKKKIYKVPDYLLAKWQIYVVAVFFQNYVLGCYGNCLAFVYRINAIRKQSSVSDACCVDTFSPNDLIDYLLWRDAVDHDPHDVMRLRLPPMSTFEEVMVLESFFNKPCLLEIQNFESQSRVCWSPKKGDTRSQFKVPNMSKSFAAPEIFVSFAQRILNDQGKENFNYFASVRDLNDLMVLCKKFGCIQNSSVKPFLFINIQDWLSLSKAPTLPNNVCLINLSEIELAVRYALCASCDEYIGELDEFGFAAIKSGVNSHILDAKSPQGARHVRCGLTVYASLDDLVASVFDY